MYHVHAASQFSIMIPFKFLILFPENARELSVGADEFFGPFSGLGFEETRLWRFEPLRPPLMPVCHVDHAHGIHFTIAFGTRACCMSLGLSQGAKWQARMQVRRHACLSCRDVEKDGSDPAGPA